MKRRGKWTFLLLFVGTGIIYLACVDHWQVYADSLAQAKKWYKDLEVEEKLLTYVDGVQTTGQPSFVTGNGGQSTNGGQEGQKGDGEGNIESPPPTEDVAGSPSGTEGMGDASSATDASVNDSQPEGGSQEGENPDEGTEEPDNGPENTGPQYMTVEDDYFSDAVFIGDSRTMGLFEYGGLEEISTFYCSRGLTIYEMFEAELATDPDSKKKLSVEEALEQNTFSKIYLMLGINEMGGYFDPFVQRYREVVDRLQELQPDAIIYVQAIIRVTEERSAQGDYITNEGIEMRNDAISQMADNEKVFYLDVNPLVCDESGGMIPSYTTDGVHLKAKYIEIWKDFLKSHAICLDE